MSQRRLGRWQDWILSNSLPRDSFEWGDGNAILLSSVNRRCWSQLYARHSTLSAAVFQARNIVIRVNTCFALFTSGKICFTWKVWSSYFAPQESVTVETWPLPGWAHTSTIAPTVCRATAWWKASLQKMPHPPKEAKVQLDISLFLFFLFLVKDIFQQALLLHHVLSVSLCLWHRNAL